MKINSTVVSESDVPSAKPKYDFSNVNLATGEGAQLSFDSWEEMDEYFDAYIDACEKAGIEL